MAGLTTILKENFLMFSREYRIDDNPGEILSRSYDSLKPRELRILKELLGFSEESSKTDILEGYDSPKKYNPNLEAKLDPDKNGLSVATWNVEYSQEENSIIQILRNYPVDVLALQEVDIGTDRVNQEDRAQKLSDALEMKGVYAPEFYEIEQGGLSGNLTLSRYEINESGIIRPRGKFPWEKNPFEEKFGARVSSWIIIEDNKQNPYLIINAHLENLTSPRKRTQQIKEILQEVEEIPYVDETTMVLTGDFNSFSLVEPQFNYLREQGFSGGSTYTTATVLPENWQIFCLDHIFVRNGNLENYEIGPGDGSDHRIVTAKVLPNVN